MKNIAELDKDLPSTTTVIQIDTIGSVTKKRFLGDFECKIANIQDQINSAKHEALLNGEFAGYLPPGVLKVNKMLAYLKYTLLEPYPRFWIISDLGIKLKDSNVIEAVYIKVLEFEDKWMSDVWGEDAKEPKSESKPE